MTAPLTYRPPLTPALVVSRSALEANLAAMQGFCAAAGVNLRAHGKMHKCSTLALLQIERGAIGVCAQTVGEAEVFARAGVADILVTAPLAPWGAARVAAMAKAGTDIKATIDSEAALGWLAEAACAVETTIGVVVDLDLGLHRTGAYPTLGVELAQKVAATPGLRFDGVQAYLGHVQHMDNLARRELGVLTAIETLREIVRELTELGLPPRLVSGGGTGTFTTDLASGVFNELQAGSYAFMDVEYDKCGAPNGQPWPFQPALFLAASVISANHKSHVTIDAGLKALSSDGPPARVVGGAPEGSLCRPMGDEHSALVHPSMAPLMRGAGGGDALDTAAGITALDNEASVPWPDDAPKLGNIVWLQPGHCDPTVNLYDALYVVAEDGSAERWAIDARRGSV